MQPKTFYTHILLPQLKVHLLLTSPKINKSSKSPQLMVREVVSYPAEIFLKPLFPISFLHLHHPIAESGLLTGLEPILLSLVMPRLLLIHLLEVVEVLD